MSSQSPASTLYDSTGTALAVYNNTAITLATQPSVLFAGNDGYNSQVALMTKFGSQYGNTASNNVSIQTNATLTSSGSTFVRFNYFGTQQINLIVNVPNAPTGTSPTLTFTIQEVDPGDETTTFGSSATTTTITNTGVFTAVLTNTHSSAVKVSWTVGGTGSPTFTGVYATITTKESPDTQTISGTITASNPSVGTDGSASLTSDTQVGGVVSTNNPAYVAGNLSALSLTTYGGLRIAGTGSAGTAAPGVVTIQGIAGMTAVTVTTNKGATSAVTSVAQSTSNTVILASNANRLIASIYNNTGQKMFIKLGTTANTTTSYTIPLMPNSYWEVPSDYTGEIDAVWMGSGSGNALVTEVTP